MKTKHFCQSCSMPLDNGELAGTEKDGTKSHEYCKYCYQNGEFTHPGFTVEQMASHIIKKMEKEKVPEDIIETCVNRLRHLKRWRVSRPLSHIVADKEKNPHK
jgi:radical SAM superfamily enzyme